MESNPSQDTIKNQVPKPKRGKTRAEKWKKKRQVTKGRVFVDIPSDLLRVVGPNAQQFITEASYLMKQHYPLNVKKWAQIGQDVKDTLIATVNDLFEFPNEPYVPGVVEEFFKLRYRCWRYNLRLIYRACKTDKERLSKCPSDIDPEQWKWLVNYWGTDEFRAISEANAESRRNQENLACVGTKSISRIATDLRMEHNDEEIDQDPEYIKLFVKQRQQKDGGWINAKAEEDYKKLLSLHGEQIESFGVDSLSTKEAYTKVFGHKSGYLRGMGAGPLPLKRVKRTWEYVSPSIMTESDFQARLKAELEVYTKQKDVELQETVSALKNQFKNDMVSEIRKLREELTPSNPLKESANASSAAHQIDEGLNDAEMHEMESENVVAQGEKQDNPLEKSANMTIASQHEMESENVVAQGEKQDNPLEKSANMTIASQPKNPSSISQSKSFKVSSTVQRNKTLGVKAVNLAQKSLNDANPKEKQNDQPGMVCVVCQITVANIEAYMKHMNDIKHKKSMEKYSNKAIGGHVKAVTRIKKEK